MDGYPEMKKVMTIEAYEETRLELRLCPPGEDFYSIDTTNGTNFPPKALKGSHKRGAQPAAVVGWPPVRTSRKNIRTTSSNSNKAVSSPEKVPTDGKKPISDDDNSLYVKINMDGVAIGRKVDLKAYDNYQRLSSAVDELFRELLAAQGDATSGITNEPTDVTTGLLDGSGEYTLVYEDNEGDRILVGDVPWDMFISSAKRLRVLKTSELSVIRHRNN